MLTIVLVYIYIFINKLLLKNYMVLKKQVKL